jgi:hypothetical protein
MDYRKYIDFLLDTRHCDFVRCSYVMAKYVSVFFAAALLVTGLTSCSGGSGHSQPLPQIISPQSVALGSVEALLDRPEPIPFPMAQQIMRENRALIPRVMRHRFSGNGGMFLIC